MKSTKEIRKDLVEFVRRDLIGPAHGDSEMLEEPPRVRYGTGILFPRESRHNESDAVSGVEGESREPTEADLVENPATTDSRAAGNRKPHKNEESPYDDTVTLANTFRPSAMGLSFMVDDGFTELVVEVAAAVYDSRPVQDGDRRKTVWQRRALAIELVPIRLDSPLEDPVLAPGLLLRVVTRPPSHGRRLVTLSVYNATFDGARDAATFCQVSFSVRPSVQAPAFPEYRSLEGIPDDPEETALAMLYRRRRVFAVGHGCAASWEKSDERYAHLIRTAVMPAVRVPPVDPLTFDAPCLNMEFLAGESGNPQREIPTALMDLCDRYASWIDERKSDVACLEDQFHDAAARHLALCQTALHRMRAGVQLLQKDALALRAFRLVNKVMLMQQLHSRLRRKVAGEWKIYDESDYVSQWGDGTRPTIGYWRAFQLAFILMNLPSLVPGDASILLDDEDVLERDLVDLIWFSTGGGKTEAYLGVSAFVIFTSRLYDRERKGCRVLMRYTLRLLTSQQFQRAASLVCACELVRRRDPQTFGDTRISIGLWVGKSLTPNENTEALRKLRKLARPTGEAKNPFQLLSCPWCGTELDNRSQLGYADRNGQQIFQCPARECPFSTRRDCLPVAVVDESIYADPPTILIGTVDKFAMLTWRPDARPLLQAGGGPDLIIQDELHLISGPLGSMVGLYEGVIDYLCSMQGSRRPKIIASTATIRRAKEQCRALYDRPMFQFPPPGLDASDSYFAKENDRAAGRLYVGFLPTASSSPLTAQIRSVVALQQGALCVGGEAPDEHIDPYWTLVQYFGSLKELGRAATFIGADIPEFLPTMHRRYGLTATDRRFVRSSDELTSRKNEDEIPKILKRLESQYRKGAPFHEQALDTLLATNMISVGVDVDRLGLMMVVTQPKGTSEYIQASSRVGRRHPGLVFTLYNSGRPRDRSHYEQFVGYHDAFYRFVEPTSVTPFSPPAMTRALHGVLVLAARHVCRWARPDDLDREDATFIEFVKFMRRRVRRLDPDHAQDFDYLLDLKLSDWDRRLPDAWGGFGHDEEKRTLMRPAGTPARDDDDERWETPSSLRTVDVECQAHVVPRYRAFGVEV